MISVCVELKHSLLVSVCMWVSLVFLPAFFYLIKTILWTRKVDSEINFLFFVCKNFPFYKILMFLLWIFKEFLKNLWISIVLFSVVIPVCCFVIFFICLSSTLFNKCILVISPSAINSSRRILKSRFSSTNSIESRIEKFSWKNCSKQCFALRYLSSGV